MSASFLSAVGARCDASAASVASATRAKPPPEGRCSCCEKYKQIFVLRNRTDADAVPELITLFHGTSSVLLRHEVAYVLGQMQRVDAVPFLEAVLTDVDENPITRHEAAEALAGIGAPDSLAILTRHAHDAASEVSDTCGLALATIGAQLDKGAYSALFALRDAVPKAGDDALEPLCKCLASPKESALLKHEVAFVLGQLEHTGAVDALCDAVSREHEHSMVRHEAAEALGAIGTARAIEVLREHAGDEEEIVRESCWVALMWLE